MEDRDFFDTLYQGWSKTTGAETTFWMPELFQGQCHAIWAVDQDQNRKRIATGLTEADAAWITALHGCFGDLVRRLHMAVDEAERFSVERDDQEVAYAELAIEYQEALDEANDKIRYLEETMRKMDQDLIKAQADAVYWEAEARGRGED